MKKASGSGFAVKQPFGKLPFLTPGESFLLRLLMIPVFFFVRARGIEHIRHRNGPLIFACNHNNSLESVLVPAFLTYHCGGRKISFVVDWMFGKIPFAGSLLDLTDPMYVYHKKSTSGFIEDARPRELPSKDAVSRCCERLSAGKRVGLFPEGKRNRDPFRLLDGKTGVGHIALRSGVPVVPVGIDYAVRRKKARIPVFGRIILSIGEPLCFDDLVRLYRASDETPSSPARVERHRLAARATRRIMRKLSGLCGKRYEPRNSTVSDQKQHHPGNQNIREEPCPV